MYRGRGLAQKPRSMRRRSLASRHGVHDMGLGPVNGGGFHEGHRRADALAMMRRRMSGRSQAHH